MVISTKLVGRISRLTNQKKKERQKRVSRVKGSLFGELLIIDFLFLIFFSFRVIFLFYGGAASVRHNIYTKTRQNVTLRQQSCVSSIPSMAFVCLFFLTVWTKSKGVFPSGGFLPLCNSLPNHINWVKLHTKRRKCVNIVHLILIILVSPSHELTLHNSDC